MKIISFWSLLFAISGFVYVLATVYKKETITEKFSEVGRGQ